jgi:exodeoxyribonuclease VII small subunit
MTSSEETEETRGQSAENTEDMLSKALEKTLANLNTSIERMEGIVSKFESGDADLDESIRQLSEANELAVSSSKELDRAVQKVVYRAEEEAGTGIEDEPAGEDIQDS